MTCSEAVAAVSTDRVDELPRCCRRRDAPLFRRPCEPSTTSSPSCSGASVHSRRPGGLRSSRPGSKPCTSHPRGTGPAQASVFHPSEARAPHRVSGSPWAEPAEPRCPHRRGRRPPERTWWSSRTRSAGHHSRTRRPVAERHRMTPSSRRWAPECSSHTRMEASASLAMSAQLADHPFARTPCAGSASPQDPIGRLEFWHGDAGSACLPGR